MQSRVQVAWKNVGDPFSSAKSHHHEEAFFNWIERSLNKVGGHGLSAESRMI